MTTLQEFYNEWNNGRDTMLVHTSGSTGAPKPLWVEKQRMLRSARLTCDFLGLRPGDTALLCLPLGYIAGKMMVVRAIERHLHLTSVTPDNHPMRSIIERCPHNTENSHSTLFSFAAMVPSQVYCSLQDDEERSMLMRIRHLIIGGGSIPADLEQQLRSFPNAVWSTYGMTETLSHIALRRISGPEADAWYTPLSDVQVSISHDEDNGYTQRGCLTIFAPQVCSTPLRTNDIAELHADGRRFRIIGRRDNVICSGGIKIQAEEIEEILRQHISCPLCITKVPDAKFGEAVTLLAEHPADAHPAWLATEAELHSAFKYLSPYAVPKHVIRTDAIPLTPTGKTDRIAAQKLAEASVINTHAEQ